MDVVTVHQGPDPAVLPQLLWHRRVYCLAQ